MRKEGKGLRRMGAWALAAAMILGAALPAAPKTAEAAETTVLGVNYAPGGTATVSNQETDYWGADKAIDGIVNRDAAKADQSRWSTNRDVQNPSLKVDLGTERTFNRFVIEWERTNITGFMIETSDTGNDNDWTEVYRKSDSTYVDSSSKIELENPATARYARLTVTDYTGNAQPDDGITWASISVYEFKIIADVDVVGEDILKNLSLDATASASGAEDTNSFGPEKAKDGNSTTRWASANRAATEENPHWLQLAWDSPQTIQTINIHWERCNPTAYSIQKSDNGTTWENVKTFSSKPEDYRQTIQLDAPVTAQYLRVNITAFDPSGAPEGGNSVTWSTVSIYELETYSYGGILETEETLTLQDIVDGLDAPTVSGDTITLPAVEGYTVELLADYEQVVGRDGTIYQPLTDKTVKAIYKVTQGTGEDAVSAEGTQEYTLTIPGKYGNDTTGRNPKPTVIPELAEWYGGTEGERFTVNNESGKVYLDASASALRPAAEALVADYNAEMGANLTIADSGSPAEGDIYFTLDNGANGLGEEGYIMEIGDHVTVKADYNTGAYWATRSILQIAELNSGTMPKGTARDYPKYEVRGFMLDVARKPISMDTLKDIAKEMAYYKMNEFHVHLNDNLIFYEDYATAADARDLAYTGFRLESDIVAGGNEGLNKADLTNKDLYYTKEEFRSFILECRSMGVNITPEFDTPGHSGAFTKVRPDLMLQNVVSGAANRAGEQFNLSEEKYDDSLGFVKRLWDEYLTEEMFDQTMTVHIGTDEYYGNKNRFRVFSDDLIEYVQSKGYTVRLWGSLSQMPGDAPVRSEGVQMNVWNTTWAVPADMYNAGFELINTIDGSLYMVPSAGYYHDYLNTQNLYNNWTPNNFGGTVIPAGSDQMLGSTYAIWNDSVDTRANGISEIDIYDRFADAVPTMASKNWGEGADLTYADMRSVTGQLGDAANSNPYHKAEADTEGRYLSYEFDDTTDSSGSGRDLETPVNAEITGGSLNLTGGESYVTTPIDKLATGNTLEFDITLESEPEAGDILFEADNEGNNDDYVHDIRIMDDGRLGFRRELYDYYFDYTIPVGEKVHLAISTEGTKTTLFVDGESYAAMGVYRNRQTDGEIRKENIAIATLQLPLQRIGSKTNAIAAVIDNVEVLSGAYVDETIIDSTSFTVTSDNENPLVGSEGPVRLAFDGDTSTFWHSNYTPYQALPATVEINMNDVYTINKFSYLPRQTGTNGIITEYSLYYKTAEENEWIPLAENQTWVQDASLKSVRFDAVEAQYLKFVAHNGAAQGDNAFASAAEFTVHKVIETPVPEPTTYTVTIDGTVYTVKEGEVLTVETPAKPGHSFDGFYLVGTDTAVDFTQPVTGSMNVESRFTQYTVTAVTSGDVQVTVGQMDANGQVTVTAPVREGYNFLGWKVNGAIVYDQLSYTFVPTADTQIEPVYEAVAPGTTYYNVTINGTTVQVAAGSTVARPADPVREGYTFIGWYVGNQVYDFATPVTSDLVIEARFQQVSTPVAPGNTGGQMPGSSNQTNVSGQSGGKAVSTGDVSDFAPWALGLVISAGAGVVLAKRKRNY